MAKKQRGFAQKVGGKKGKEITQVKLVRSIQSQKTGHWRFNEQMISVEKGETVEAALKRLAKEATVSEMNSIPETAAVEEQVEEGTPQAEATEKEEATQDQETDGEDSSEEQEVSSEEPAASEAKAE